MSNDALELILQSFRGGVDDQNDPLFREAFEKLSHDPELAVWFREEQEFDAIMAEKFRDVPVKLDAKMRLLREVGKVGTAV